MRCEQCRQKIRGTARKSITGRTLCSRCADRLTAASVGGAVNGGVGGAVATAGWFERVKKFTRGRRSGS